MKLESNIWKFYAIALLGIRFIAPIRILYLLSFGLSFTQIGMMELAAAIAIVILEIPSGMFADMMGRKNSRLIAYGLSILAFLCLSFGSTVWVFIVGWALSGAADAFESGAQDALIFDTLKELNREDEYVTLKSRFLLISTITTIVGSLVGAYLYIVDPRLPWYLVTITIILSASIFMFIVEPRVKDARLTVAHQFNEYKVSFRKALSSINVQQLILLGLIFTLPMYVFTTLVNQPYLLSRGYSIQSLGFVFAFITGISGFIASFSDLLEKRLKKRWSFILLFISFSLVLLGMGLFQNAVVVLVLIVVFYVVDNYKNIILDNYLNLSIDSESRATVISVKSFVTNIGISGLFVFIGFLTDNVGIDVVLCLMGLGIVGFGGVAASYRFKHK